MTLLRILLIPVLVIVYYLPIPGAHIYTTIIFILGGVTDWLDGYLARRLNQHSAFGAFLDPVADKLTVAAALVLVITDARVIEMVGVKEVFIIAAMIIIGREIVVSALREWMAELGSRASVAVSVIGKFKTASQMVAIGFLLFREPILGLPIIKIGEILLYMAATLTLWSMIVYLRVAWPALISGKSLK